MRILPYKRLPVLGICLKLEECKHVDKVIIVDERHVPITQELVDEHKINIVMHAPTPEEHDFHRQFYEGNSTRYF